MLYFFTFLSLNITLDADMRSNAPPHGERNIHKTTTLETFIALADDPTICGNCLDLPSLRYTCPSIIRLDTHYLSFSCCVLSLL